MRGKLRARCRRHRRFAVAARGLLLVSPPSRGAGDAPQAKERAKKTRGATSALIKPRAIMTKRSSPTEATNKEV